MEASITLQKIKENFENDVIEVHSHFQQDTAVLAPSALLPVATFLKEDPELQYNYLMDLTAVDYWKRKPRFEVVYHFLSVANSLRVRLKVPVAEPEPKVDSLSSLWPGANWYEREVYDMFGIQFTGHPDLRRILLYPEFEGHPLRKDYPIQKRQPLVGPKH
jgi:NADH-quinone oxidoreductase subunit C